MKKYINLTEARKFRLSKVNAARIEELMIELRSNNLNQTMNFLIDNAAFYIEIKKQLKSKGVFHLNEDTARLFGIRL